MLQHLKHFVTEQNAFEHNSIKMTDVYENNSTKMTNVYEKQFNENNQYVNCNNCEKV